MSKRLKVAGTWVSKIEHERARGARRQRKAERKGRAWQDVAANARSGSPGIERQGLPGS